jgi:hypothetical protein
MKPVHRSLVRAALSTAILMVGSSLAQQQQPVQLKMPSDEQVTIFRALRNLPCRAHGGLGCHDVQYRGRTIEFDVTMQTKNAAAETTHYVIDLTTLATITYECIDKRTGAIHKDICDVRVGGQKSPPEVAAMFGYCGSRYSCENFFLAKMLNRVREFSLQTNSPLHNFSQAAAAWRALPQRPPISDAVRVQRMLAEEALKQGQPYMALYYYESGLEKDPLWPEGYFNAALVAASLEIYEQAAEHMHAYLELMPNAPDAQKARDQIAMWQYKAGQPQPLQGK